jgi:hypothetical protein
MAITEDASTPAVTTQTGTGTTITSPSFTPPQGTLLVALVSAGKSNNFNNPPTVTDTGNHSWTLINWNSANTVDNGGFVGVYYAPQGVTPAAVTVTATFGAFGSGGGSMLDVRVLNGASPDQSTAGYANYVYTVAAATANCEINVVTTVTGSVVYGICVDTSGNAALGVNGLTTAINTFANATDLSRNVTWKSTSATGVPGLTRFGGNWPGTATSLILGTEFIPAIRPTPVRNLRQAPKRASFY